MFAAMLTGAHILIMSSNAEADAAFLRDVLAFPHVDAGDNFLIFGLPPAELAMHGTDDGKEGGKHELYLIADDIHAFVDAMGNKEIACEPIVNRGWGDVSSVALPSGLKLGVYQAHHKRPSESRKGAKVLRKTVKAVRKAGKKAKKAKKKGKKK